MLDLDITLEDKCTREEGQIYLNGSQALVRLALEQARFDERNGLNTAGFISGYRGSPLGVLDFEMWRARKHLEANDIESVMIDGKGDNTWILGLEHKSAGSTDTLGLKIGLWRRF